VKKNAELAQRFQTDETACRSDGAKSDTEAKGYRACMVGRGYIEKK
jgi:hypothetical protein